MPITPIPDYTCLTDEQVHELQAECQVLIAAVSERTTMAESRRGTLATIGAALVAARVATVAGAISILDKAEWWIACAVTGLCLTMTGLSIWFLYARQTNRYPWTGGTTTWKWFYRDALPDSNALRFGATSYFWGWRTTEFRIRRAFISQLSDFRLRFIQLKDKKTSLDQDIQQLYVLHVNEEYKNLHLRLPADHYERRLDWVANHSICYFSSLCFSVIPVGASNEECYHFRSTQNGSTLASLTDAPIREYGSHSDKCTHQ